MKKRIFFAAIVTSLMATSFAYADNLKIGVVDMNQVMQKAPLMVSMNDALSKKFKPRQDEINNANKKLQDEVNQLNYDGATMSQDVKSKLQNQIIADKANVEILTASFQRDIAIAKDQDLRQFMTKLSSVITKMAQDGHYDIIEQRTNMLYVNNPIDITQQVLQQVS